MLFWLSLILIALGLFIAFIPYFADKWIDEESHEKLHDFLCVDAEDAFIYTGALIFIVSAVAALVMLIVISTSQIGNRASLEKDQERYNALIYKVESDSYRDEFGLLNKEVIDEIQEWNEDLAFKKSNQRDFWIGIFIPNIYDDFEKIDYEKF